MRLKLLIADDHQLMLEGIRLALADAPDIEIVGETSSGAEVFRSSGRRRPTSCSSTCVCPAWTVCAASSRCASGIPR